MKLKRLLVSIMMLFSFGTALAVVTPQTVLADDSFNKICSTTDNSNDSTVCQEKNNKDNPLWGPTGVITKATQLISILVGIASVFMIIISGIRFITSSGDPNTVNGAKNTLLYAVIGLIVAVVAQVLVGTVISKI